jgi:uncharacterized protein YggL (DUF469 family)
MPVHRVIYRLDFEPNFDIIDSTGKVLGLIKEAGNGNHWPDLGEISDRHSVSGRNSSREDGWWTSISIEPAALIGEFETLEGLSVEQIEKSKFVSRLFKITNTFRKEFKIEDFKRIGFRLIFFEEIETDRESLRKAFQSLIDKNLSDNLVKTLGGYTDLGIAFNGQHEDGLLYKMKCGPYADGELKNYLPNMQRIYINTNRMEEQEISLSFTMDIDLYEQNVKLSETTNFNKWCYPVLGKDAKAIDIILQTLKDEIGKEQ